MGMGRGGCTVVTHVGDYLEQLDGVLPAVHLWILVSAWIFINLHVSCCLLKSRLCLCLCSFCLSSGRELLRWHQRSLPAYFAWLTNDRDELEHKSACER
jgi:hypothetical protein